MKHMKSESNKFETEQSRSRVIWLLIYFLFPSCEQCHCKTVAPFGLRAEECPQSQENPHGDLSLKTMSIGDTVRRLFLIAWPRMGLFLSVVQPKKTLAALLCRTLLAGSSMLDSPEERPLLNLTCLHFQ